MRRALLAWTVGSSLLCCLLAVVAAAQDGEPQGEDPDGTADRVEPEPQPEPELSPAERARRAKVLARIGQVTITLGQVEDAVAEQSPHIRSRYRDDPEQLRSFVESMVRFELLARAAERAEVGEDPEVQQVVKQNAIQQLMRRDFDQRFRPETVPEEDVREYYASHPDEFTRREMRRAAHIQVADRDEAERLIEQARAGDTAQFRRLARDHSLDPENRLRGGDLRYFDEEGRPRNRRDPRVHEAIAQAAFGLEEVGDVVGEPVQVGERWSVVKLTGMREAQTRSYEQAAPIIRLRLFRQRRQRAIEDFVAELRRDASVQAEYDLLRPIRLDPPPREDREDGHGRARGAPPAPAAEEAIEGEAAEASAAGAEAAPQGEPAE